MQIVPPCYLVPSGQPLLVSALSLELPSWFADTVAEPIPEKLAEITRRIDAQLEGREAQLTTRHRQSATAANFTIE